MDQIARNSGGAQAQTADRNLAGGLPGFLLDDAKVTQKAFTRWFNESFIKSTEGQSTPKATKKTVHGLYRHPIGLPADRGSQQPEVLLILSQWEQIPLEEGSREWSKARIRLIRDLLFARSFPHFEGQGFHATESEIREARHWFRKSPDGTLTTYQSLPLLCKYKNLQWDAATRSLKTVVAADLQVVPAGTTQAAIDPETIRISNQTFEDLLASNGHGPEHNPAATNGDEELIEVSEDEPDDTKDFVPWKDIPLYIGLGTRGEPFLEDRLPDPPAVQHQPALIKQEPLADTEVDNGTSDDRGAAHQDGMALETVQQGTNTNGSGNVQQLSSASEGPQNRHSHGPTHGPADIRMSIEDSADDVPPHEDQRDASVAISEASTAMVEGGVDGEADGSDKENAVRGHTHRADPPTIRQSIASVGMISPLRVPSDDDDDDEMVHGHTSPDAMDIRRGIEGPHMPNRSVLGARKREPTPIDITGGGDEDDMMDTWADELEEMELDDRLPRAIRRALRANAEGNQPNIPGGNKRRRI
ncbi:MAG: hypothetical protein Q9212_002579 [Teloschistes hypoglaucus]